MLKINQELNRQLICKTAQSVVDGLLCDHFEIKNLGGPSKEELIQEVLDYQIKMGIDAKSALTYNRGIYYEEILEQITRYKEHDLNDMPKFIKKYTDENYYCPKWLAKKLRAVLKEKGAYDNYSSNSGILRDSLEYFDISEIYDHNRKIEINQTVLKTNNKFGVVLQPYEHARTYIHRFYEFCDEFGVKGIYHHNSYYFPNRTMTYCIYDIK